MALEFFDKVLEFFRRNIGIFQEKIAKKLAKKDKPVWIQLNAKCSSFVKSDLSLKLSKSKILQYY